MSEIRVCYVGVEIEDERFNPGLGGGAILRVLLQRGAGFLRNFRGITMTDEDQNLPAGDYTFTIAASAPQPGPGVIASHAISYPRLASLWQDTASNVTTTADNLISIRALRGQFQWEKFEHKFQGLNFSLRPCTSEAADAWQQPYGDGAQLVERIVRILLDRVDDQSMQAVRFINQRAADGSAPDVAWCGLSQGVQQNAQSMYEHLRLVFEYKSTGRMSDADGITEGVGQLISRAWSAMRAQRRATMQLPGAVLDNVDMVGVVVCHAEVAAERKLYRSKKLTLCQPGSGQVDKTLPGFKDLVLLCWLAEVNLIQAQAEAHDVCLQDGDDVQVLSSTGAASQYTVVRRLGTPGPAGCAYQAVHGDGHMVVLKVGPPPSLAHAAARLHLPAAPWSQVPNEARLSAMLGQRATPALATCVSSGHLQLPSTAAQAASWVQGADVIVVAPCGRPLWPPGREAPVMATAEAETMAWQILGGLAVLQEAGIIHGDVHARNIGVLEDNGELPGQKHSHTLAGGTPPVHHAGASRSHLSRSPDSSIGGASSSTGGSIGGASSNSSGSIGGASSSTHGSRGSRGYRQYYLFDLGSGVTTAEVASATVTGSKMCLPQDLMVGSLEVLSGHLPTPLSDAQALLFTTIALTGQRLPWKDAAGAGDVWGCGELRQWFMTNPGGCLQAFSPAFQQLAKGIFTSCIAGTAHNFSLADAIAKAQAASSEKVDAPAASPAAPPRTGTTCS